MAEYPEYYVEDLYAKTARFQAQVRQLTAKLAAGEERERALREALVAANTILRDADLDEYVGPQIRAALALTEYPAH